jgi:hypothetical protein
LEKAQVSLTTVNTAGWRRYSDQLVSAEADNAGKALVARGYDQLILPG